MVVDLEVLAGAVDRWRKHTKERDSIVKKLGENKVAEVEPAERIKKRFERLADHAVREITSRARAAQAMPPPAPAASLVETIGFERVIGSSRDFLGLDFLEVALAVSRSVARIRIKQSPLATSGYGTGFLVSPHLLLTNQHVLKSPAQARYSEAEFDYQTDRFGRLMPVKTFRMRPEVFFLMDRHLDYALVALDEVAADGTALGDFGWNKLIGQEGKALLGDPLNIIQHPSGEPKQIVLRQNTLVQLLDDFAHYLTDTEPGSSGSPVFNDQWEAVALHHSGVPRTDNGSYLAKDGSVWTPGMDPGLLDWVANEGIRASRLVQHIKQAALSPEESRLRTEMLEAEPPNPVERAQQTMGSEPAAVTPSAPAGPASAASAAAGGARGVGLPAGEGGVSFSIPLTVTVSLGGGIAATLRADTAGPGARPGAWRGPEPASAAAAATGAAVPATGPVTPDAGLVAPGAGPVAPGAAPAVAAADEAVTIDPDYESREGYDPDFLGEERTVRLPWLTAEQYSRVAFNRWATGSQRHVLPYHHFSVVMDRTRRQAFFTAVNIDGDRARSIERETDTWHFDPRIPRGEQAGNDVYASNPLDRGHLVRRLDPAWGVTEEVAKFANDDTFHWTNCSPQHERFNRNKTLWGGIEDYILDNAKARDLKVTVFTGPVLRDDDPEYRGIQLPRQYWKVVAMVKEDGGLSATAYLLSQAELVSDALEEDFAYGAYRTFQVPIHRVEELTELSFRGLGEFDPTEALEAFALETAGAAPLASFEEIVF